MAGGRVTEVGDRHLALNNGMPVFLCLSFFFF